MQAQLPEASLRRRSGHHSVRAGIYIYFHEVRGLTFMDTMRISDDRNLMDDHSLAIYLPTAITHQKFDYMCVLCMPCAMSSAMTVMLIKWTAARMTASSQYAEMEYRMAAKNVSSRTQRSHVLVLCLRNNVCSHVCVCHVLNLHRAVVVHLVHRAF